ncbi:Mu-like prophage I protein [Candidatus Magnetoovum chiemensis]|nr:Mu-like prophage I protein [Candidatus Magnetoovum chiemensis]
MLLKSKVIELKSAEGVPATIQILAFGETTTTVGRYTLDAESAYDIIVNFQEKGHDIVIDYEHQTMSGSEAPAAGWIKTLQITSDGIAGTVEWTERAAQYIAAKEYRYLSPVLYVVNGRPIYIESVALTNLPATFNAQPLISKQSSNNNAVINKGEKVMNIPKEILESLGLADGTVADVQAAIMKLKQSPLPPPPPQIPNEIYNALGIDSAKSVSEVEATILAMKQNADVNKTLFARVQELEQAHKKREAEDLVALALKEAKITPAQVDWARQYAAERPDGFAMFIAKASAVIPIGELKKPPVEPKNENLSETARLVAKQMGLKPEDVQKYIKPKEAA